MSQPEERPPIYRLTWSAIGAVVFIELLFTAVIVAVVVLLCVRNHGQAAEPDNIERAVRGVLAEQVAAWNKGDLNGFMTTYWHDDRLTFYSGGTATRGWQSTLDRYRKRYQAEGKEMGSLAFAEIAVEPLAADAAVARGRWKLTLKDGTSPNGLFTLILRRIDGHWRIVHDHTSSAP